MHRINGQFSLTRTLAIRRFRSAGQCPRFLPMRWLPEMRSLSREGGVAERNGGGFCGFPCTREWYFGNGQPPFSSPRELTKESPPFRFAGKVMKETASAIFVRNSQASPRTGRDAKRNLVHAKEGDASHKPAANRKKNLIFPIFDYI